MEEREGVADLCEFTVEEWGGVDRIYISGRG
jgi:hypothetical protein